MTTTQEQTKELKLTMTREQAYQRKQKLWKLFVEWKRTIIRAFFPDTAGVDLYMHNWYACAEKTNPKGAALADWIQSTTWARYYRLEKRMEARDERREHLTHGKHFRPLWCPLCKQ